MESLHWFLDEDKGNVSREMGVIIYESFLISNCHYGRGGGKVTRAWKYISLFLSFGLTTEVPKLTHYGIV